MAESVRPPDKIPVEFPTTPMRATRIDGKIVVVLDDVQAHLAACASTLDEARANPEISEALRNVSYQLGCLR